MRWLVFYPEPKDQLFAGVFALLVGLVLAPFLSAKMVQLADWMYASVGFHPSWIDAGTRLMRGFFAFACGLFAVVGALQLTVYAAHRAGLIKAW